MNERYILGIRGIAKFFGLSPQDTIRLLHTGGIPGVIKLKRRGFGGFQGGGRGIWAIRADFADALRHTQQKTPRYDPRTAVDALLNKYGYVGADNIPELIASGVIDDYDWCDELRRQRELSNLHIPILMHKDDLAAYLKGVLDKDPPNELYLEAKNIFRPIRRRRNHGSR